MQLSDRLIGVLVVVSGLLVIAGTLGFREIPGQQFGSAFFPRILGGALIVTGIVLFAHNDDKAPLFQFSLTSKAAVQTGVVFLSVVAWVFVVPYLGFIFSMALMILILAIVAGGRWLPSLATAVPVSFLLYFIFSSLLRVPLPIGFVERLLL